MQSSIPELGQQAAPPAPTPPAEATPPPAQPEPNKPAETPAAPSGKKGLDAIPDLNAEPEPTPQEQPKEEPKSPQKLKWDELRTKAEELDKLKPELETLRKQLEEASTTPQLPEDVAQELEELRQLRFATEVENTPEWREGVSAPWEEAVFKFKEIADFYEVDVETLLEKADDKNSLKRGAAIREFLQSSDKDVTPEVLAIATDAASRLHQVYAKMAELKGKSDELYQSIEAKRSLETEQQKAQRESAYAKSRESVVATLSQRLPDVFKNADLAADVKQAAVSDDPTEQAYQAVSALLLPEVASQLKVARTEIARLERIIAGKTAAAPGLGAPSQQPDFNKPQEMSLLDAMRASGLPG